MIVQDEQKEVDEVDESNQVDEKMIKNLFNSDCESRVSLSPVCIAPIFLTLSIVYVACSDGPNSCSGAS